MNSRVFNLLASRRPCNSDFESVNRDHAVFTMSRILLRIACLPSSRRSVSGCCGWNVGGRVFYFLLTLTSNSKDRCMCSVIMFCDKFFAKLNTRSPTDVGMVNPVSPGVKCWGNRVVSVVAMRSTFVTVVWLAMFCDSVCGYCNMTALLTPSSSWTIFLNSDASG